MEITVDPLRASRRSGPRAYLHTAGANRPRPSGLPVHTLGPRHARPPRGVLALASDASRWRARGVPAICYGPQPTLSAGLDDYAEEQEVLDCAVLYAATALAYLAGDGAA